MANTKKKKEMPSLGLGATCCFVEKHGIPCICAKCKTSLGNFLGYEDHSGVLVVCKCGRKCLIPNGLLLEIEENPKDYEIPLKCEEE